MELTQEQSQQIKEQLLKQLDNFPEDKRDQIKQQIESMTPKQVEEFVKQNQLTHMPGGKCIFCSIAQGKTKSFKIDENENNLAILELNPLSKGHTLIVPKEHLDKLPNSTNELAQKVSEKLQNKLNPKQIRTSETKIMEHPLIEVVPIYEDETSTERKKASEEELKELQEELTKAKEKPEEPEKKEEPKPLYKMEERIP